MTERVPCSSCQAFRVTRSDGSRELEFRGVPAKQCVECEAWLYEKKKNDREQLMAARAIKDNAGKPPVTLVPQALVYGAARAYKFGITKYKRFNFRTPPGLPVSELLDAAGRHILERANGLLADPESGLDPLDHAAAALGMAMDTLARVKAGKLPAETDDTWKEPA